jgi:heme exporter protein D
MEPQIRFELFSNRKRKTMTTTTQFNRNQEFLKVQRFLILLTIFLGIAEAYAWYSFGFNVYISLAFAIWAIFIVFIRPIMAKISILAIQHRQSQLASAAEILIYLTVVLTFISIFIVYADAMEEYKENRLRETASYRLAQTKLNKAEEKLATFKKEFNPTEIERIQIRSKQSELQNKLQIAQENYQKDQQAFWLKTHSNGLPYHAIMDRNGNPKTYNGGLLKTATREIKQELQAIKTKHQLSELSQSLGRVIN